MSILSGLIKNITKIKEVTGTISNKYTKINQTFARLKKFTKK